MKNRTHKRKECFCARLFAVLISIPPLAACFAQEQAIIKTTHVAGSVYMLEGRGGNIGVSVGEDGILIVDNQFDNMAPQIEAALADLGKGELKFVTSLNLTCTLSNAIVLSDAFAHIKNFCLFQVRMYW